MLKKDDILAKKYELASTDILCDKQIYQTINLPW